MVGSMLLGQIATAILFLLITIFSVDEFIRLSEEAGAKPNRYVAVITGGLVYILVSAFGIFAFDARWLTLVFPLLFIVMIAELYKKSGNPFQNIAWTILAILYIAIPFALLTYFFGQNAANWQERSGTILGFFVILWLNDTGAYFIGSLAGKHRLFERISPKKSWEGSIGGGVVALLTAWGISFIFTQYTIDQWLLIALVIIVLGTLGDLVESMLKRSIEIKDSGNILPGHGGLLDRFDAVLLASPFVFVLLTFLN
jgi:phosphatidate cytidylyltransferase